MEICRYIIDSPVPVDITNLDEEERLELPWWKAKKWAMHICVRTFERYGSPGNEVNKEYKKFAEWYLPTFTRPILESLLKMLDSYRNNIFVSSRVLTEILSYMKIAYVFYHHLFGVYIVVNFTICNCLYFSQRFACSFMEVPKATHATNHPRDSLSDYAVYGRG